MILLDTNVISESMRIAPDRRVMSWLDRHPASSLFLCAITVDEIAFGVEVLPSGRKRTRLAAVFSRIIDLFSGRIIAFDTRAATESAKFRGKRHLAGSPMSLGDSQIAGIAKSRGYALATLNARDFRDIDLSVLEPR